MCWQHRKIGKSLLQSYSLEKEASPSHVGGLFPCHSGEKPEVFCCCFFIFLFYFFFPWSLITKEVVSRRSAFVWLSSLSDSVSCWWNPVAVGMQMKFQASVKEIDEVIRTVPAALVSFVKHNRWLLCGWQLPLRKCRIFITLDML